MHSNLTIIEHTNDQGETGVLIVLGDNDFISLDNGDVKAGVCFSPTYARKVACRLIRIAEHIDPS